MKRLVLVFTLLALPATADGYRDCSPKKLDACQNSNQLFWGQGKGRAKSKTEFSNALTAFLQGAPKLFIGNDTFSVADRARNSLIGPGNLHDHLPDGSWFFDGFTPHDATDQAAVVFTADGNIQAVALLNSDADKPSTDFSTGTRLHIYTRSALSAERVKQLRHWAGKDQSVAKLETILVTFAGKGWSSNALP